MREQVLALVKKYLPGALHPVGESNVITKCPFHKGGDERKPSFSINLDKGLFHCFTGGCPASSGGNLFQLLKMLEVPKDKLELEIQAVKPYLEAKASSHKLAKAHSFKKRDPFKAVHELPESVLGVFDFCPMDLVSAGFDPSLLQRMEVGYDIRNERITYPIRDIYGVLAGFSAGATPRSKSPHPKYKVYEGRRRSVSGYWIPSDYGEWFDEWFPEYTFENHNFLWNYNRVWKRFTESGSIGTVYVVEGFKACLWMMQAGFENTVAAMGSYLSEVQQQLLHRLGSDAILCFDNDAAGRTATLKCGDILYKPLGGKVRCLHYPDEDRGVNTQPDDYELESLRWMVGRSLPYPDHVHKLREERKR